MLHPATRIHPPHRSININLFILALWETILCTMVARCGSGLHSPGDGSQLFEITDRVTQVSGSRRPLGFAATALEGEGGGRTRYGSELEGGRRRWMGRSGSRTPCLRFGGRPAGSRADWRGSGRARTASVGAASPFPLHAIRTSPGQAPSLLVSPPGLRDERKLCDAVFVRFTLSPGRFRSFRSKSCC